MKQRNIAISLSTLGALALVALFTIVGNAAEKANQIVAPDMKPRPVPQVQPKIEAQPIKPSLMMPRPVPQLQQKIEAQPFNRGLMTPQPVPQLERMIEVQPIIRGVVEPRPAPQPEQKVDEAMGVLPSLGPSKVVEAQPFKPGLLKDSLSLYSRKGQRLEARYTKNEGYALYDLGRGNDALAADGSYRLQGGGQIEVKNGYVTFADELAIQRSAVAGVVMAMP